MSRHRSSSSNGMGGEDYMHYEPALFRFENDDEAAAAMDQMIADGDIDIDADGDGDADPVTPYGSAGPSAHTGAAASGRLHLSSAQVWQNPEHSSPPPLTYSPSPRTTSSFQHRHQDASRQQRQRYSSHRNSTQHQHQLSRQNSTQGLEENGLSNRISDLSLRQDYQHQQQVDDRARRHRHTHEQDPRLVPSIPRSAHEQLEDHVPPQRPSYDVDLRHPRSASRNDHFDPEMAAPQDLHQPDDSVPRQSSSHDPEPRRTSSVPQDDHEEPEIVEPLDDQEYVQIPKGELLDAMYNGDEESRVTAQKIMNQAVHAVQENGRVVVMVGQATAQWWMSPEMAKRRRSAGRKVLDVSGQVVSGAVHVIMTSTPLGRACDSVSTNVTAFKAAPFSYALQGLGIKKDKNAGAAPALPATDTNGPKRPEDSPALNHGKETAAEPVIADVDDDDFDEETFDMGRMFDED